ncbi:hypothetical protein VQ02_24060 [Methylobacterium variabile]|jgi:ribosomal-protein-alanine N-acetyltransferase|uniref:N-acetyltransferase domain-containing protein n=1 Tax=Methylobacterium variabile TaxID=298794 RepID=A0A0J6SF75_9HYPH|nr:GNAT family N-acetyltransferase [Methylobacterium variabile]KMO32314.1 hypothetical protein VQ02_24060 [Methylobacterium variabile]
MTHRLFPVLETTRLRLRLVVPEDAVVTATLMTPEVSRWVASWPVPFTVAMAQERIATARAQAESGEAISFAVTLRGDGTVLGWAMAHRMPNDPRCGTIGYWLGEAHHRQGYLRELAPALLATAFVWLDLDAVEASAHPENAASFAVMRRCGLRFRREAVIHAPARSRDEAVHIYGIRREECHA